MDPFSGTNIRNVLQHIISPKIVGPTAGGYQVEVDLINIDKVYANEFIGLTGGGSGTTGSTGPTGAQGPTGSAGATGAQGPTGAQGVTGATGASGVLSVTGPSGAVAFFSGTGITGVSRFSYNLPTNTLDVDRLNIDSSGPGALRLSQETIEIGYINASGSGNRLSITDFDKANTTAIIDTSNKRIGIQCTPTYPLDVAGQAQITFTGSTASSGSTAVASGVTGSYVVPTAGSYTIHAWGGGGISGGGAGGAGGYVQVSFTASTTGGVLTWTNTGGGLDGNSLPSGGDALRLQYYDGVGATADLMWAPGGGGGAQGASGAAFGELRGKPLQEGGFSATSVTGGSGGVASYTDLTDQIFTFGSPGIIPGGTFSSGQIGATGATGLSGTVFQFSIPASQSSTGGIDYYTLGSTGTLTIAHPHLIFSTSGLTSTNASFIASTFTVPSGTTGVNTTGVTGTAIAVYDPPGTTLPRIEQEPRVHFSTIPVSIGSGTVTWTAGGTAAIITPSSYPYTLALQGSYTDVGNQTITLNGTTQVEFSQQLPTVTGNIYTTGNILGPSGSTFGVTQRNFIVRGFNGITGQGGWGQAGTTGSAGGGGYYGGGGAGFTALQPITSLNEPAGGGAGSAWITSASLTGISGITGITYGGSGVFPFTNQYNPSGVYAAGGIGSTAAGSPFLTIVQSTTSIFEQSALIVNGIAEAGAYRVNTNVQPAPPNEGSVILWNSALGITGIPPPGTGSTMILNARGVTGSLGGLQIYDGPDNYPSGATLVAQLSTTQSIINSSLNITGNVGITGTLQTFGTTTSAKITAPLFSGPLDANQMFISVITTPNLVNTTYDIDFSTLSLLAGIYKVFCQAVDNNRSINCDVIWDGTFVSGGGSTWWFNSNNFIRISGYSSSPSAKLELYNNTNGGGDVFTIKIFRLALS